MTTSHRWAPGMHTVDDVVTGQYRVSELTAYTERVDALRADEAEQKAFERAVLGVLAIACLSGLSLGLALYWYTDWPGYSSGGLGLLLTLFILAFGVIAADTPEDTSTEDAEL